MGAYAIKRLKVYTMKRLRTYTIKRLRAIVTRDCYKRDEIESFLNWLEAQEEEE